MEKQIADLSSREESNTAIAKESKQKVGIKERAHLMFVGLGLGQGQQKPMAREGGRGVCCHAVCRYVGMYHTGLPASFFFSCGRSSKLCDPQQARSDASERYVATS